MKFKKPKFWDYKNPNLLAYLLLPLTYFVKIINYLSSREKIKSEKIKTICVGNIYIGGTGKTPLSIKINNILKNLNFKSAFIKKKYYDQYDEQKILFTNGKLFCEKNRVDSLKKAINENIEVAVFDDGLQDNKLSYDITIVCFNSKVWIGNGLCIPSGPLRENLKNLKKYDAVFLNGSGEENIIIEKNIKSINPNIKIFRSKYIPIEHEKINLEENYVAFSGIGNPDTFINTLNKNNFKIVKHFSFPDHYNYSEKDIKNLKEIAKNLKAKLITTEKDYNRLSKENSENINFLKIELKIIDENKLVEFLNKKL